MEYPFLLILLLCIYIYRYIHTYIYIYISQGPYNNTSRLRNCGSYSEKMTFAKKERTWFDCDISRVSNDIAGFNYDKS